MVEDDHKANFDKLDVEGADKTNVSVTLINDNDFLQPTLIGEFSWLLRLERCTWCLHCSLRPVSLGI
jgi:hypothetical protein